MLNYSKKPLFEFATDLAKSRGIKLLVKREDLNHPFVSGNKWWKLKYNLEQAVIQGHQTLLTFGGAYSNHIYSTAAAAQELGLKSIGIIRGEETLPLNSTLSFVKEAGMQLYYVSREEYKRKNEEEFIGSLKEKFGDFYLIPEGGTNEFALKGCAEFGQSLLHEIDFDYLCLPVGTGGTIAGIICGLKGQKKVIGFSSLKGSFLKDEVTQLVSSYSNTNYSNWRIEEAYHFGGYAKLTEELIYFIKDFEKKNAIPLDQIYTAKMFYGVFDLIAQNYFEEGSTILLLHTGGLQGRAGSNF
ncbi:MAG TPA: pyridoxal-phosphate dependent enzyme [Cyclobacteriaceae bacterium]